MGSPHFVWIQQPVVMSGGLEPRKVAVAVVCNACPACHHELDMVQPDIERPGRQLGICHNCERWLLIQSAEGFTSIAYDLPTEDQMAAAMMEARACAPNSINTIDLQRAGEGPSSQKNGSH